MWKVRSGGGCTFEQTKRFASTWCFQESVGVQPGGADDSDHHPELSSLYTANVNCRVLNKGYHDDALGTIHSSRLQEDGVGLSSVKQFSFD